MRLAALAVAATPQFTIATLVETLDVLGGSIVASLLYAIIGPRLPGKRGLTRGILFGTLLAALLLVSSPNGFDDELRLGLRIAGATDFAAFLLLFAALCISFGIALVPTFAWLERSVLIPRFRPVSIAGYVLLVILAGLSIFVFVGTLAGPMP
jgi:hypothetical protein